MERGWRVLPPCPAQLGASKNNLVASPAGTALLWCSQQQQRCHFGVKLQLLPILLSWWPPLPSQLEQFVPKSVFICKLKFHGECLAKGRKCFGAGPGWGSPIPGGSRSIPVEAGTRGCRCHGNAVPKFSRMSCKICSGFEDKSLISGEHPGAAAGGRSAGSGDCFGVKVGGFGGLLLPGTSRHSLSSVPEGGEAKVR